MLEHSDNKEELCKTLAGLGWKDHPYLPKGWIYRDKKLTEIGIFLISKEGKLFQTYKAAVWFMRSSDDYTSEEVDKLYLFPDGNQMHAEKRRRKTDEGTGGETVLASDEDWNEDDKTVLVPGRKSDACREKEEKN